jgi:hypothetical protein
MSIHVSFVTNQFRNVIFRISLFFKLKYVFHLKITGALKASKPMTDWPTEVSMWLAKSGPAGIAKSVGDKFTVPQS